MYFYFNKLLDIYKLKDVHDTNKCEFSQYNPMKITSQMEENSC